jgi:4-amino-4-deoxy-L-arabinose transferase-like glycosyltransferase
MTADASAVPARRRLTTSLSSARSERLIWLFVATLIVARTALALVDLSLPGLEQDETLFVNAATVRIPDISIVHSFHGVPLMVYAYTGALKSWIYDPIFAVFGTSATTIRAPVAVFVALGLLLLFVAVRDLINTPVALLTLTVLCFDNSVFWLTRNDVGPSAIEFTLKCVALFSAARMITALKLRWIALLLVVLGLGVFNKLNFIWMVNAAAAVSVLVAFRYRRLLRREWTALALWVGGLAAIYACWAVYYFADHISSINAVPGQGLTQSWLLFTRGTSDVLSGRWFYNYALAPMASRDTVAWIVVVLFVAGGAAAVAWPRTRSLYVSALALTTVAVAVQILFTPQATAGWHYVAIYPFVTIVAAYGVYAIADAVFRRPPRVYAALACVAAVSVVYSVLLMVKYFDALQQEPKDSAWSPAIYRLSADVRRTHAHVFTVDWGIFNPLFALDPGSRYTELSYDFQNADPTNLADLQSLIAGVRGPKLIVTHVTDKLNFPTANTNVFRALGKHLHLAQTVAGANAVPVYQVYWYG